MRADTVTAPTRDIRADILAWRVCVSCGGSPLNGRGATCLFIWPATANILEPVCLHCQTVLRADEVLRQLHTLKERR